MLKFIKNVLVFGLKVLMISYIFVLLEEAITQLIFWVYDKCMGLSSEERENKRMERYYKKNGIHCPSCDKWYPITFTYCPLCKKSISLIRTMNKQLEIPDVRRIQ